MRAEKANADTLHFTHCSPQHWLFNESSRYWQGVKQNVLEFEALVRSLAPQCLPGTAPEGLRPSFGARRYRSSSERSW
jgi:hypothetical protein